MNNDFEVHAIGTAKEITLSRTLARTIESELKNDSKCVSSPIYKDFVALLSHYNWQIENEKP